MPDSEVAQTIELRGAVALLGSFPALSGVDFVVGRGEVVAVRGPNGAGKTTLLRVCAGLVPVTSGEARVLGRDLTVDRRPGRGEIGMLGHGTHLYDDLTAEENVTFQVRAARCATDRVVPALERLGITGRIASARAGALSAGQRRRTAVAALVACRQALWLLDEPHAGLDARGREILDEVIAAAAAEGTTIVAVTHEDEALAGLATAEATMSGGMITSKRALRAVPHVA